MAVKVEIFQNDIDVNSVEFDAANDLKAMLLNSVPEKAKGHIYIGYSLTLTGQEVRDIDLLLLADLENCVFKKFYTNNPNYPEKDLSIKSFCIAIELKSHSVDRVSFNGTDICVDYKTGKKKSNHSATQQNLSQRYAVVNYFARELKSAYVTNFLWLKNVTSEELDNLKRGHQVGALPNQFDFRDVISMIIAQGQTPYYDSLQDRYELRVGADPQQNVLELVRTLKNNVTVVSKLTQERLNHLTQSVMTADIEKLSSIDSSGIRVVKGSAGTGKTFLLLQYALNCVKNGYRCLMVTYNHALVSDIKRLLHFMKLPEAIDDAVLDVQTSYSFFISIMRTLGIKTPQMESFNFEKEYQKSFGELKEYVFEIMSHSDIKVLKDDNQYAIDWDYIFVDEAQDWNPLEKEVLIKLYGAQNIIVSDGGRQFIKSRKYLEWNKKNSLILTMGKRQKSNLIAFANTFADKCQIGWKLKENPILAGGQVIVKKSYTFRDHYQQLMHCYEQQGDGYDLLMLVPPELVGHNNSQSAYFSNSSLFESHHFPVFDGTNYQNRCHYPTKPDECRLFQYESCRGLEAWVTVCLALDKLYESKMREVADMNLSPGLAIESIEDTRRKYVYNWIMMPLTRAIDTLFITIKDPDSEVGRILHAIANENPGIVKWEI